MNELCSVSIFSLALLISYIVVPFICRWALELGLLDLPDTRKKHLQAVPRLGGIAIFIAWIFPVLVFSDMGREVRGIMAGSLVIFLTGLIDDVRGLSPLQKLMGQIGAGIMAITVGGIEISSLGVFPGLGTIDLPQWLAVPFTLFAVIGVMNAFNMIDGLDGLAGGIAFITLSAFTILGYLCESHMLVPSSLALLGAVLGFLKYNSFPARIFMGDTGSLTLGFIIAFTAIQLTQNPGDKTVDPLVPALLLIVPILDTIRVSCSRILRGRSPFSADRNHLHHKLLNLGFGHRSTVLVIWAFSVLSAGFALLGHAYSEPKLLISYTAFMIVLYLTILASEAFQKMPQEKRLSLPEVMTQVLEEQYISPNVQIITVEAPLNLKNSFTARDKPTSFSGGEISP